MAVRPRDAKQPFITQLAALQYASEALNAQVRA